MLGIFEVFSGGNIEYILIATMEQRSKTPSEPDTQTGSVSAPRQKPLQSFDLLPEFTLEDTSPNCFELQLQRNSPPKDQIRKKSLDLEYTILGFISRKIQQRSRVRLMSEDLHSLRL